MIDNIANWFKENADAIIPGVICLFLLIGALGGLHHWLMVFGVFK